ncbi:hypothetical protein P7228_03875 [Altererythrobacter arenosus]|uniref:Uncharacterized protein n=1 Tax=Altererythrobacter arenosus TaxID=3032592 RepID=A0ABY8FXU2_9SPHN|nr:hypothetical protein [Altererythrobacter sp. CAU 1644]WFL78211.1 hypothetical protein P7228_03875 [Altererythrobacter sp. CAU 1644]
MRALALGRSTPYVWAMLSNSRFNPATGLADFWSEFRRPHPYRWPILGLSMLPIGALVFYLWQDVSYAPPARPEVTYITSYSPDRTDEEIAATNEANQRRKDELAQQRAEIENRKREMYRELGRASGMDVDAMERQIAEDKAREEAAKKQAGETVAERGE